LLAPEGGTVRKYLSKFDANDTTIAAVCNVEDEVYSVQQELMWWQCTVMDYNFNAVH
jgi:hypothetical protein